MTPEETRAGYEGRRSMKRWERSFGASGASAVMEMNPAIRRSIPAAGHLQSNLCASSWRTANINGTANAEGTLSH